ncbi:MAG: DUF2807 domain-containing protein [Paludibacter sp.]|jgi:phage shock protein PspC (stress-responsive transcriptional regulator)|nr:DUF2807 domain-containing protein [Paludibacter sp.]
MKKTFTINLNNVVFHIDNDAYETLQQYLNEVESRLSEGEKREVMADIEARIAELFIEKLNKGKNVINLDDVEAVIGILGKPNQFATDDEEPQVNEGDASPKGNPMASRKFYRDPDKAVLGGVAAGLAAFLGWDLALIRIILVVLVIISYTTLIPIYIIVWIVAPAARTIAQKLEMQGEPVTADRIKEEINNMKNYVNSEQFEQKTSSVGSRLGEVFSGIFKVIFGIMGAFMAFVGFIVLGSLLFVLSLFIFEPSVLTGFTPDIQMLTSTQATLMVISLLLVVGIPVFGLIYGAIRILTGKKRSNKSLGWIMFVLWLLGIFMIAGISAKTVVNVVRGDNDQFSFYWQDDFHEIDTNRQLAVTDFHSIDVSGNIKVEMTRDSIFSVQATGGPTALSHLQTKVTDGVLHLSTSRFHVNRALTVFVVMPELRSLKVSGTSEVNSYNNFTTDYLNLDLSGMSKANLDVHVNRELRVQQSAATQLDLQGIAYRLVYESSGASHLDANELIVHNARVKGEGAVELKTNITDSLDVRMSGASNFKNRHRPVYHHQEVSGAASVRFN